VTVSHYSFIFADYVCPNTDYPITIFFIESGKYLNVDVNLRICPVCKNDIED